MCTCNSVNFKYMTMATFITKMLVVTQVLVFSHYVKCEEESRMLPPTRHPQTMVDPHSLYYNRNEDRMMTKHDIERMTGEEYLVGKGMVGDYERGGSCLQMEIFYKRLVNLLLSNIDSKRDGNFIEGILRIEATAKQIESLQTFENGQLSIKEMDAILSDIIKKPEFNIFNEAIHITEEIRWFLQEYREVVLIIGACILALYSLRKIVWSTGTIILFTCCAVFVISYVVTYVQLIQENQIKLAALQMKFDTIPSACIPSSMTFFETVRARIFGNDDCEQYYRAMMTDAKLQVTPALVLTHLFSTIVFHPLSISGSAISQFVENVTGELPWYIRPIIICIIFLAISGLIFMLPLFLMGGALDVSLGPLFRVSLSGKRSSRRENMLEHSNRRERIEHIHEALCDISKSKKKAIAHGCNYKCCAATAHAISDGDETNAKSKSQAVDLSRKDQASGDASANSDEARVTEITEKDCIDCARGEDEYEVGSGDASNCCVRSHVPAIS